MTKKIALCSDSNGAPYYVTPAQLYIQLIANGLGYGTVNNYAASGKRSDEIIAQVDQAIAEGNSLIIINAGTNDISQIYGGSVATIIGNIVSSLTTMIADIKAYGADLMIMSPILPLDMQYVEKHLAVERAIARLCAEKSVDFIPITSWMNDRAFALHPADFTAQYTGANWHGTATWHAAVAAFVLSRQHTLAVVSKGLPVDIAFLEDAFCGSVSSVYAFPALSLGSPDSTRQILVNTYTNTGTARVPLGCTVAGVAAVKVAEKACLAGNFLVVTSFLASIPSGTSGDVVVTYDGGVQACGAALYRILNADSSVVSAGGNALDGNGLAVSLPVPANGGAVAIAQSQSSTPMAVTWAGIFEYMERTTINPLNGYSTASKTVSEAEIAAITALFSPVAANACLLAIAFSPL